MSDNLRDRIERTIEDHTLINGADECTCGVTWEIQDGFDSTDGSTCYDNHLAGAIVRELTHAIPPIVATAIQGYAQSELAAMSYHGGSKDAFDLMEKMNREALHIAQYATTHEKWGSIDD